MFKNKDEIQNVAKSDLKSKIKDLKLKNHRKQFLEKIKEKRYQKILSEQKGNIEFPINHLDNLDPNLVSHILKNLKNEIYQNELTTYIKLIFSNNLYEKHSGIISLRKYLVKNVANDSIIQILFDYNTIQKLFEFLLNKNQPHLQLEASWCIANICSSDSKFILNLVNKGIVPILLNLIQNKYPQIAEQAIWAMGNISGDSERIKNIILKEEDIIPNLLYAYNNINHLQNKRGLIWVFSNIAKLKNAFNKKKKNDIANFKPIIKILIDYFSITEDPEAIFECLSTIRNYPREDFLQYFHNINFLTKLKCIYIKNLPLYEDNIEIIKSILNIYGGLTNSEQNIYTKSLIEIGILEDLTKTLFVDNWELVRSVCWVISNIAIEKSFTMRILECNGLIQKIVGLSLSDNKEISFEAIWVVCNLTANKDKDVLTFLLKNDIFKLFRNILEKFKDKKPLLLVYEAILNILDFYKGMPEFEFVVKESIVCGLSKFIEDNQYHTNEYIYLKSSEILDYYPINEVDFFA